jgi:tRNA1Val (adenine37-N6)-methyltransferase
MAFRFRQFSVEDDKSPMRVGTDALLLGSWLDPSGAERILDIGTGCGVIALMLAQRSHGRATGIDKDLSAFRQATLNFSSSPWHNRMTAIHSSLSDFAQSGSNPFNLVAVNPPFFRNSLRSPDARKNAAKHSDDLSREEIVRNVISLLHPYGTFGIILPAEDEFPFTECAAKAGLFIRKILHVRPAPEKQTNRVLMAFTKMHVDQIITESLIVRDEHRTFSREYRLLTDPYHTGI